MADSLTTDILRQGLERVADQLEAAADELNRLDAELGDGDLGVTMQRGVRGLREVLPDLPGDVGMALLKCAQAFVKVSGSSYGTLISTGLMSAAKATRGRNEVLWNEISQLLAGAGGAMARRGRSELGQKTVLDTIEAARLAAHGLEEPAGIQEAVEKAVQEALEKFKGEPSRIGRARIWAEQSVGRYDPGMVAFQKMVQALRWRVPPPRRRASGSGDR